MQKYNGQVEISVWQIIYVKLYNKKRILKKCLLTPLNLQMKTKLYGRNYNWLTISEVYKNLEGWNSQRKFIVGEEHEPA